ncbi:hypothetical protein KFK09_003802 [Dendrobium nobile]|uniref:Uncharacterized protein n=1 Tax=Dendrobium nobile TaxID=94219 RepID=A0A8T3C152_DENNO|nr:hypothetical protein KFK09_003802 [Dendrobium nobile]
MTAALIHQGRLIHSSSAKQRKEKGEPAPFLLSCSQQELTKSCSKPEDATVPVHIVTHASQLPSEFLNPSSDSQLVVDFDCEASLLWERSTLSGNNRRYEKPTFAKGLH